MGSPEAGSPDRARSGARHADERRAARRAHRAGLSRRSRRHADRDQPDARQHAIRGAADCGAPIAWCATLSEAPERPRDHSRQRVPRRLAGAPIRAPRRTVARKNGAPRRGRAIGVRRAERAASPTSRPRRTRARCWRSTPSAIASCSNSARGWSNRAARRCSSTTATARRGSATRCRRCTPIAWSTRSPLPASCDLTAHVDFAAMARSAQRDRRRRLRPDRPGRFPARDRHRREHARRWPNARPRPRRRIRAGAPPPRRQGRRRNGRAVQGDGRRRPQAAPPPGFQPNPQVRVSARRIPARRVAALPGLAHGFFTRRGGVSTGVYASLNGGVGSRDPPEAVRENRARMAAALGVAPIAWPFPIRSTRPTPRDLRSLGAGGAAALRRAGHGDAGPRPRRHRRGLRHDPVRRPATRASSARRMRAGRAR